MSGIWAIILAAGESKRMKFPKMLLPFRGTTIIEQAIENVIKVRSGIDKSGMITLWDYHVWFAGTRGSDIIYNVPNFKTTSYHGCLKLIVLYWAVWISPLRVGVSLQ